MKQVSQAEFWQQKYENGDIGFDMGFVSPPLKAYFDQMTDKSVKILLAGAGNAYEAEYLHQLGFHHVVVVDFAKAPLENFAKKYPTFPPQHLLQTDFFALDHQQYQFDYAFEQTFFCAIDPARRGEYVQKMYDLLKPQGKLVGLLFNVEFVGDLPPFGGNQAEYEALFSAKFQLDTMETCRNSHPKRQGNELFIQFCRRG